jgi:transcriptional regulator with XRE-family HTH domain
MASLGDIIAANVRAERARRRWHQSDLAARLGWSVTKVGDLESGRRRVLADYLPELCRVFDISLDVLIMGADPVDVQAMRL